MGQENAKPHQRRPSLILQISNSKDKVDTTGEILF